MNKKIMSFLGLLLIGISLIVPGVNLNAAHIDYNTDDFYLTNNCVEKIHELDVSENDIFEIGVKNLKDDLKLEIGLPVGINLDQKKTAAKKENSGVQIAYSEEAKNIILTYENTIDTGNEGNTIDNKSDLSFLVLKKDDNFSLKNNKLVAKSEREGSTVYSEPLFLVEKEIKQTEGISKTRSSGGVEVSKYASKTGGSNELKEINVGETFFYVLTIKNTSKFTVKNVDVQDTLPEGIEYVRGTTTENGVLLNDSDVWSGIKLIRIIGSIGSNSVTSIKFEVRATGKILGNITNSVYVKNDGKTESDSFTLKVNDNLAQPSDVTINKKASNTDGDEIIEVKKGEKFVYQLLLENTSINKATDVLVEDTLPSGINYVNGSTSIDGVKQEDVKVWKDRKFMTTFSETKAKGSHLIQFEVMGTGVIIGNIRNVAYRNYRGTTNSSASNINMIENIAEVENVTLTKEAVDVDGNRLVAVNEGDSFYYKIIVSNEDRGLAKNINVKDLLPKGIEYLEGTTKINGLVQDDDEIWNADMFEKNIEELDSNGKYIIEFEVQANGEQVGEISNIVSREYRGDEITSTSTVYVKELFPSAEELTIKKSAINSNGELVESIPVGDSFYYKIVVENKSEITAKNLTIRDMLPDGVQYIPRTTTINDIIQDDTDIWIGSGFNKGIDHLNSGESVLIKFRVFATGDKTGIVTNNANLSAMGEIDNESSVEVVVEEQNVSGELLLEKTVNRDEIEVGDEFEYNISIMNDTGEAGTLILTDGLPAGVERIEGTTMIDGVIQNEANFWTGEVLVIMTEEYKSGTEMNISFKVRATGEKVGVVTNTAVARLSGGYSASSTVDVNIKEKPISSEDFKVTKQALNSVGEEIIFTTRAGEYYYEISVTNKSTEYMAYNILVEDQLPEGINYISGTTSIDGVEIGDDNWEDDRFNMLVSRIDTEETKLIRFKVRVNDGVRDEILNKVMINDQEIASSYLEVRPEIKGEKNIIDDSGNELSFAQVGDVVYYAIEVENLDEQINANKVVVKDVLRNYLKYQPGTTMINGEFLDDNDVWNYNELTVTTNIAPGEKAVIKFATKINKSGENGYIINDAQIGYEDKEYPGEVNDPMVVSQITPLVTPEYEVNKSAVNAAGGAVEKLERGEEFYYQIDIENISDKAIGRDVSLKDELPKGIQYLSGTTTLDGVPIEDNVWNNNSLKIIISKIPVGASVSVKFKVSVDGDAQGILINTATVDELFSDSSQVEILPSLYLSKRAVDKNLQNIDEAKEGDIFYYLIVVRNEDLEIDADDVNIRDELPDYLEYQAGTTTLNGITQKDEEVWNLNVLTVDTKLVGEELKVLRFGVKAVGYDGDGEIKNTALAEVEGKARVTAISRISGSKPELSAEKRALNLEEEEIHASQIGNKIYYDINVTNSGSRTAYKTNVIDELNDYLEYQAGTTTLNGKPIADSEIWKDNTFNLDSDIKGKESLQIRFEVKIVGSEENLTVYNVVRVNQSEQDEEITSGSEVIVSDTTNPKLNVEKLALDENEENVMWVTSGDEIYYRLIVRNTTQKTKASDVVVEDTLQDYLQYVPGTTKVNGDSIADDVWNGNQLIYTTDIFPGEEVVIDFKVVIAELVSEEVIYNEMSAGKIDDEDKAIAAVEVMVSWRFITDENRYKLTKMKIKG